MKKNKKPTLIFKLEKKNFLLSKMFYSRGYGPTGYFLMSSYKVFF